MRRGKKEGGRRRDGGKGREGGREERRRRASRQAWVFGKEEKQTGGMRFIQQTQGHKLMCLQTETPHKGSRG